MQPPPPPPPLLSVLQCGLLALLNILNSGWAVENGWKWPLKLQLWHCRIRALMLNASCHGAAFLETRFKHAFNCTRQRLCLSANIMKIGAKGLGVRMGCCPLACAAMRVRQFGQMSLFSRAIQTGFPETRCSVPGTLCLCWAESHQAEFFRFPPCQ